jgi:restriction system protein
VLNASSISVDGSHMTIPDYQTLMLPLLRLASDRKEHQLRAVTEILADEFALSSEERNELLPSGSQFVFANRVGWARTYLKQAGLIDSPRRGFFRITQRGLNLLQEMPLRLDVNLLERFPEFLEFRARRRDRESASTQALTESAETPEDSLAAAYQTLRADLEAELLQQVKDSSPTFFERLVVELLVKMGYGGSRQDAGRAIGRSGDGGIDGIINEDRLGLDVIYSKPSVGTRRSVALKSNGSLAPSRDSVHARESSLQLPALAKMRRNMLRVLILGLSSLMVHG